MGNPGMAEGILHDLRFFFQIERGERVFEVVEGNGPWSLPQGICAAAHVDVDALEPVPFEVEEVAVA
jgi:hypothetical protein